MSLWSRLTFLPRLGGICVLGLMAAHPVQAQQSPPVPPLAPPQEAVVLVVNGKIGVTNGPEGAQFDLPMLQKMGVSVIDTSTIWSSGKSHFEGVPLMQLLTSIKAEGSALRLTALNDYSVEIPMSVLKEDVPILAYAMDGAVLSSRDKGPLWLMFPFDDSAEYQSEENYVRAVWQLIHIEVLP